MAIPYTFRCSKQWDALDNHPLGKYCNSCNKIVHDFSSMTDEEIILYLKKRGESVCIMQKNTRNRRPKTKSLVPLYTLFFGFIGFLGIGCVDNRTLGEPAIPGSCEELNENQTTDTFTDIRIGKPAIPETDGED